MPNSESQTLLDSGRILRTGRSELELRALRRFEECLPWVPARRVAHYLLWDETQSEFAAWAGLRSTAHLSSTLSRGNAGRTNAANRALFALRFGVPRADLDHLIDSPRPDPREIPPLLGERPAPLEADGADEEQHLARRDGTSLLERRAVARVEENLAAFPPGEILLLAMFPYTLKEMSQAAKVKYADLSNMLAWIRNYRYPEVRQRLCTLLDCSEDALAEIVERERTQPVRLSPAPRPPVMPPKGQRRR